MDFWVFYLSNLIKVLHGLTTNRTGIFTRLFSTLLNFYTDWTKKLGDILYQVDLELVELLIGLSLRTIVNIFLWLFFTNPNDSFSSTVEVVNQKEIYTNPQKSFYTSLSPKQNNHFPRNNDLHKRKLHC